MTSLTGFGLLLLDDHPLCREWLLLAIEKMEKDCGVVAVSSPEEADAIKSVQSECF